MKALKWVLLAAVAAATWSGCGHPKSGAPATRPDSFNNEASGVLWKWKKDE
jgi:hypothetical protein